MRTPVVLFSAVLLWSCSSPVADSRSSPESDTASDAIPGCYSVQLGGKPAQFVSIPTLIELSSDPAPNIVEPGRLAVKEPGTSEPRAPISWWASDIEGSVELVLGGGYTGYSFALRPAPNGSWVGEGTYFADIGVLPEPGPLPVRLTPRSCS